MLRLLLVFLLTLQSVVTLAQVDWRSRGKTMEEGLHLEAEGVYRALGPMVDVFGEERRIEFNITIIKSIRTGSVNLTVSNGTYGNILYFASEIPVVRVSDHLIVIESFGLSMTGGRQFLSMEIDPMEKTIRGVVDANYLPTEEPIEVEGKKDDSVLEAIESDRPRSCGKKENYTGLFRGDEYAGEESEIIIKLLKDRNGKEVLTANLHPQRQKILYPDGNFDEGLGVLTLENDLSYNFTGRARKMTLLCDQDENDWILRGFHLASNGVVIPNLEFRKPKKRN